MDIEKALDIEQFYRFPFVEFGFGFEEYGFADITKMEQNKDNVRTFMRNSFEYTDEMLASPRFIKTHLPICFLPPDLLKTCKVIYVARNVKDVCVSSYYHMRKPTETFSQWAAAFKDGKVMVGNWFEHMRQAWEVKQEENIEFFWYEDMKEDIRSVIGKVAKHLGKDLTEEEVERLVEHVNIDNMRQNKAVNKTSSLPSKEENFSFVRKGVTGDWKNHFTEEESQEWDKWIEDQLRKTGIQGMRGWKD